VEPWRVSVTEMDCIWVLFYIFKMMAGLNTKAFKSE